MRWFGYTFEINLVILLNSQPKNVAFVKNPAVTVFEECKFTWQCVNHVLFAYNEIAALTIDVCRV